MDLSVTQLYILYVVAAAVMEDSSSAPQQQQQPGKDDADRETRFLTQI